MSNELQGMRVAIVATDGFEQAELFEPKKALEAAGAAAEVIAPHPGSIQGMRHHDKGETIAVAHTINAVRPQDYDALVLPGGVANPDALRLDQRVVSFVRSFFAAGKPMAAICHGPWTLIEAEAVKGQGADPDLVAVAADRSDKRRRALGGSGGRHRRQAGDKPQAGRSPRLLPRDGSPV